MTVKACMSRSFFVDPRLENKYRDDALGFKEI